MAKRTCSIDGCEYKVKARGWCSTHYNRWARHGSTDDPRPSIEERFWAKVDKSGDCWLWTAAQHPLGYGNFWGGERYEAAHRVAYRLVRGPIPDGLVLDHLCRTPACVNPSHLDPVPQRVNVYRGESFAAENARKAHCVRGHPLFGDNLYVAPKGDRRCRACRPRWARTTTDDRAGA